MIMKAKFTDLVKFTGRACKPFNGQKWYISTGCVHNDHISDNETEIVDYKNKPSRANLEVVNGDIIFAKMQGTKKTLVINDELENYIYSTGFCAIRSKNDVITNDCLYYLISSRLFLDAKDRNCSGATQKAITKAGLSQIELNIPSLKNQEKIGIVLKKLDTIMRLRSRQLQDLDTLTKARFVEMFEDQNIYESEPLDNNVEEMFIGPFGSSLKNEYFVPADEGYCMVYEQKHAIRKTMNVDTRFIDKKKYDELRRFTIHGGDIIVSCRGTIGETFIVPDEAPIGIMHPSIMKIRLNNKAYNRVFFNYLLRHMLKRHEAEVNGSGVKMAITATALGRECFIRPPMSMQEQFSELVAQVDKSKFAIEHASTPPGRSS